MLVKLTGLLLVAIFWLPSFLVSASAEAVLNSPGNVMEASTVAAPHPEALPDCRLSRTYAARAFFKNAPEASPRLVAIPVKIQVSYDWIADFPPDFLPDWCFSRRLSFPIRAPSLLL